MFYVPAVSGTLFQELLVLQVLCMIDSKNEELLIDGLSVYDKKKGIDWKWQAMDGVITKAPLGGKMATTMMMGNGVFDGSSPGSLASRFRVPSLCLIQNCL
jgi:hypothetical protein